MHANNHVSRRRRQRWPEWLQQLQGIGCAGSGDSWNARWIDAVPRVSRRQLEASDRSELAAGAGLSVEELEALVLSHAQRRRCGTRLSQEDLEQFAAASSTLSFLVLHPLHSIHRY